MSLKRQFIKSVLANYIGYIANILISFVATPIIVNSLGKAQYGLWSLVMSLTGYYGLLNLGMRSSLTKYLAEYNTKNDDDEFNKLFNSSFIFFISLSIITLLITYFLKNNFTSFFKVKNINIQIVYLVVLIVGINISLSFLSKPFESVLVSLNRFDIRNAIGILFSLIKYTGLILILKSGFGIVYMAIIVLIVDACSYLVNAIVALKIKDNLILTKSYISLSSLKKLFNFGVFNFMRQLSKIVLNRTDTIIIGIFLGLSYVAIYSIAESLIRYAQLIIRGISRVTLPISSSISAKGDFKTLAKFMLIIPKYIAPIGIFIFIEFFFYGYKFIQLWIGDSFHQSYVIFCILMSVRVIIMTNNSLIQTLVGAGFNKFFGLLSIIEAISNIVLSVILLQYYGLIGVALGTVIPLSITRGIIVPFYSLKIVKVKFSKYINYSILPALVASIPCIIVSWILNKYNQPSNYFEIFINVSIAFVVMTATFFPFIDNEVKEPLKPIIKRLIFINK